MGWMVAVPLLALPWHDVRQRRRQGRLEDAGMRATLYGPHLAAAVIGIVMRDILVLPLIVTNLMALCFYLIAVAARACPRCGHWMTPVFDDDPAGARRAAGAAAGDTVLVCDHCGHVERRPPVPDDDD